MLSIEESLREDFGGSRSNEESKFMAKGGALKLDLLENLGEEDKTGEDLGEEEMTSEDLGEEERINEDFGEEEITKEGWGVVSGLVEKKRGECSSLGEVDEEKEKGLEGLEVGELGGDALEREITSG
jgi:hypothetical protein